MRLFASSSHFTSLLTIKLPIMEIDQQIHADECEIDKVDCQHIRKIIADDLGSDSRKITDHNQENKGNTHSLGGVGFDVAVDVQRPGKTKADEHNGF